MKKQKPFLMMLAMLIAASFTLKAEEVLLVTNASTPLAEELIALMHLDSGFQAMKVKMSALTAQSKPAGIPQDIWDKTSKQSADMMKSALDAVNTDKTRQMIVSLYAETFSPAELQGLIDFYKTPVGQKWIEKQPQMQAQIMMKMQAMMKDIMPAIMKSGGMPAGSGSSAPIQPVQTTDKAPSPNPTP
jgi:uncharacterized protein